MLFFSRLIDGKKVQKNRNTSFFKRILHPKMKILSSFTHPQVVWVSVFSWTQRKIFWRTIGTKQLFGTIDFHSRREKNTMEVNGAKVPIVQNIFLCVQQTTWGWVNDDISFQFSFLGGVSLSPKLLNSNVYLHSSSSIRTPRKERDKERRARFETGRVWLAL